MQYAFFTLCVLGQLAALVLLATLAANVSGWAWVAVVIVGCFRFRFGADAESGLGWPRFGRLPAARPEPMEAQR